MDAEASYYEAKKKLTDDKNAQSAKDENDYHQGYPYGKLQGNFRKTRHPFLFFCALLFAMTF